MTKLGFFNGLKAGMPIAIGYFPVAITFGLLAKSTGLSLFEAMAMSIFVYAGASQYISLTLISKGVDPIVIVLNTFVVNFRHFLMSASLNEKMAADKKWRKGIFAFLVTDETFSVLATRKEERLPLAFGCGVNIAAYTSWWLFTAVGHLIGANLPLFLQSAMSIALYAMFIGLLVPSMKGNRKIVILAASAALINCLFYWTNWLTTGWAIIVSALASALIVEIVYRRFDKKKKGAQHSLT
ncbi:AzlC family ABC transporter permease [Solibacillus sp. CAU 1738]|uniref:AzlC family ABC transporter permease n=1 Tax=Solibacillus sp. CAU 1738 TaxID=3140363 RepID=UPI003260F2DB